MPYLTKAKIEHLKLEAKIEVLELANLRITEFYEQKGHVSSKPIIQGLINNLVHMKQVIERRARI